MKKKKDILKLIKDKDLTTKIKLYFSTKQAESGYDKYEDNYSYTNLNPLTIKGYVSQVRATSLVWNEYGLKEQGAVNIICEDRYKNWFEKCNKVVIDGDEYEVFKEGTGGRALITSRPFQLIKVVLRRK